MVASKLRRAARKIRLPCSSFSRTHSKDDPVASTNISNATTYARRENVPEIAEDAESGGLANKNLCAICLEPLSYRMGNSSPGEAIIFTAQCSHAFHFTCISSNVRHGNVTCPICRAHWTQLPRNVNPPCSHPCNQTDPILRILDDSIATFRVHRRYSLRSARYDDDDPVEPDQTPNHPRLHLSLIPVPLTRPSLSPCRPPLQITGITSHQHHPRGLSALQPQFTATSSLPSPRTTSQSSSNGQKPYPSNKAAYLSVRLAYQQPTDLVLVASPNGPHLRLLKQSMALAVFSLRSVDRLAIVTYSSAAARAFPLRRMTSQGKRTALQVIDRLFYMGEADPTEGLKKGIKILDDRAHRNPRSCILQLSDSPTRSYLGHGMEIPIPIHCFHVGFAFGTSNGFVMHEFEEFLARLLGGVIRETQLKIGEDGGVLRLGELRGGEERRIPLDLGNCEFVCVGYSYIEGGPEECISTGDMVVSIGDKRQSNGQDGGRDLNMRGSTSSVESWDYHDPCMARRWAKHLHGYRL
ncbi:PREDICTED: uncharacterized protein LOC104588550 [Nelumbo nucifera]|uniref:RING-type domain-containing protein n=2 Tax=Nelumbo nucifera TaxID=4432 RepID=A0A822XYS4_NELNU|nr:PREDICTED: uncharacterized protein LOC104588550 [Nelumbo nucifera]DAD24249.1 TPA_asm: hypothetical protein HUJ06_025712 [Nelumbo nucifera]